MDIELDLALEAAKPPAAERTPALSAALIDVLAASEPLDRSPARSRTRRRRRTVGYALGAVLAVGGGAAGAHAAGWLLPQPEDGRSWDRDPAAVHVDVTLAGGKRCQAIYMVVPAEAKAASASPATWDEVWSVATRYLEGVDASSLTSEEVVSEYRADALVQHRRAELTLPPGEVPPLPTEDEVRVNAPGAALKAMLDVELRRQDLPTDLLMMTSGDNCAPGERE